MFTAGDGGPLFDPFSHFTYSYKVNSFAGHLIGIGQSMLRTLVTGLPLRRTSFADLPPLNCWRFGSQARLDELWKIEQNKTFSSDSEELDPKGT